jgi:hypothetical protein
MDPFQVKKRQMHWTKQGAHLLLRVRASAEDDLRASFERWYPAMGRTEIPLQEAA